MKRLTRLKKTEEDKKIIISKINEIVKQTNEQKEEIRLIKQKLRGTAHFRPKK